MQLELLKAKIHRAVVTQAALNYVGSITIDAKLMAAAGILEYEKVDISVVENGERLSTYVIAGEAGSGVICLNGSAARLVQPGDHVIIMCYTRLTPEEAAAHHPRVVFVDGENRPVRIADYEMHGALKDQPAAGSC